MSQNGNKWSRFHRRWNGQLCKFAAYGRPQTVLQEANNAGNPIPFKTTLARLVSRGGEIVVT